MGSISEGHEANTELASNYDALFCAIYMAARKVGLINEGEAVSGPEELIRICDDLANAALAVGGVDRVTSQHHKDAEVLLYTKANGRISNSGFVQVGIAVEAVAMALSRGKGTAPLTDDYVQFVPEHCDRVVWHGRYYHLRPNGLEMGYRPMETVPRDGKPFRVLVNFHTNEMGDVNPAWTMGIYDPDEEEGEGLQFVGWDANRQCFTHGTGHAIGWLPLLDVEQIRPE